MTVLCHVLGLDGDKRAEIREGTLAVMAAAEDPEMGAAAFMDFATFGIGEVHRRRAQTLEQPRGASGSGGADEDGMTTIARWRMGGRPMTDLEIGQEMNSVLIAGHGTSISGIGSMFYEVLSRPDLRDKLAADESLIGPAVEEALRLHPPFFELYRRATTAVTIAGTDIAPDASVMVCWAAANRDPKVFGSLDEFRLDRPPSGTSPSVSGCTPAPGRWWSAWRCGSCSPRCCAGCPTSNSSPRAVSSTCSAAARWPASQPCRPASHPGSDRGSRR
jgi:cytochrome P450